MFDYAIPQQLGLPQEPFATLREEVQATQADLRSVLIAVDDKIVFEEFKGLGSEDFLNPLYSVTKSVSSLMFGLVYDQLGGDALLETPLVYCLPKDILAQLPPHPKRAQISLRHVLNHTTGIRWKETGRPWAVGNSLWEMEQTKDWLDFVLRQDISAQPGSRFTYNTGGSHLLPWLVGRLLETDPLQLVQQQLFAPLAISSYEWKTDPMGNIIGGKGLSLTSHDLLKIGLLVLQKGAWKGQQILSEEWIAKSTSEQSRGHLYYGQYGYHWWLRPNGVIAAIGYGGQLLFVVPKMRIIAVFTGLMKNNDFGIPFALFENGLLKFLQERSTFGTLAV